MPIYTYLCRSCGLTGDHLVGNFNVVEVICDACGGVADRQFSPSGRFILKGSGWASDGYTTKGSLAAMNEQANREAMGKK